MAGHDGGWYLEKRQVLEDLQEEEDDNDGVGERSDAELGNIYDNKIVQEVKYCSKVQFRAPDIIKL